jgi:hypothetical protein
VAGGIAAVELLFLGVNLDSSSSSSLFSHQQVKAKCQPINFGVTIFPGGRNKKTGPQA